MVVPSLGSIFPARTSAMVSAIIRFTSPADAGIETLHTSPSYLLRLRAPPLRPSSAARIGSECSAQKALPLRAGAAHGSPVFAFAVHRPFPVFGCFNAMVIILPRLSRSGFARLQAADSWSGKRLHRHRTLAMAPTFRQVVYPPDRTDCRRALCSLPHYATSCRGGFASALRWQQQGPHSPDGTKELVTKLVVSSPTRGAGYNCAHGWQSPLGR